MKDPVLARRTIQYCGKPHNLIVHGGLHHIRGNHAPHFSLTAEIWNLRSKDIEAYGCMHEEILKHFPQFADLAALHLSDIDGIPMHAEANGWYDLAGALPDNAGEQYHIGNSQHHFPKRADQSEPAKPWQTTDYRNPTPAECLQFFADHVRVPIEVAQQVQGNAIAEWFRTRALNEPEDDSDQSCTWSKASWKGARAWFGAWIRAQYPRWKQEADDCIAKHGLAVYGDPWPPVEKTA